MKNNIPIILLLVLASLNSCRKDYAHEQFTPDNNAVTPDLTVKASASVNGFIMDENSKPLGGVQVAAGDKTAVTDEFGYFAIPNTSLVKAAGWVKAVNNGYFTGYRTFTVNEGQTTFVHMQLLPKTNAGSISATSGGAVTATDGAKVELPANAVMVAASGSTYTGMIQVAARWINPSAADNFQSNMPGDSRGLDSAGHLKYAKSSGAIAVELTGDAGQLLQVIPGKKATITIPIAATIATEAPASINLWSFEEGTGFWKQESTATKNGNVYVGQVGHFTYWEDAIGFPLVNFTARVLDASLQPLANTAVMITPASLPKNAGYSKFSYTDANGYVYGALPVNTNMVLDVLSTCAISAYSHNFSTTTSDIDLGVLTGNLGQSLVTITGTVQNCSSAPVTDGYIQTYDNGFYNRIPIVNGSFSFTGLACTNTTINYIAVDNTNSQQNTPQSITLVPGNNNLGAISACGISSVATLSYTVNGATKTLSEPTNKPAGYYLAGGPTTQIVIIDPSQNTNPDMTFQFDGGDAVGSTHKVSDVFSVGFPSGRGYAPVPLTVNITEYGNVGGFISGNYSGMMLDFVSNAIFNVSCTFRVRRNN